MASLTKPIRPQPGPQEAFLSSNADLTFYGGAAFGGKTYALLMDIARWVDLPDYRGTLFRRTCPQITQAGGVWDESLGMYSDLGGEPIYGRLEWEFKTGARINFHHCQHEKDIASYKGLQSDVIAFDQLEDFTHRQFFYLLSRNRGKSGIRSYCRATYNPQPGWLADFLQWWWNPVTGYAIERRAGVLRWFCRVGDVIHWADSKEQLAIECSHIEDFDPKSCTFIPGKADDNQIGLELNPGYRASLLAMRNVDMERLLRGNHLVRDDEDSEWPTEYFIDVHFDEWPHESEILAKVQAIDPSMGSSEDSDFSAWVMMALCTDGNIYVDANIERRDLVQIVDDGLAIADEFQPDVVAFEENGFAALRELFLERSDGRVLHTATERQHKNKIARIKVRLTPWLANHRLRFRRHSQGVRVLLEQLQGFPTLKYKDGPDALATGLKILLAMADGQHLNEDLPERITA